MSATYERVFYLSAFKKNDFLLWSVCAQAYENFRVVIKDDSRTYLDVSKRDHSTELQKVVQDSSFYYGGSNLRLIITYDNHSLDVHDSKVSGSILDAMAREVGYSYTFCIEDGADDDYNDAYISIVGWRKKG